ncbi:PH domain-containing protein [Anaeromicrobium sediminis]|uniref:Uncharacterized protein YyaB-like PH domain-containing protein n=1 Tax=Anaeromicrobium sediminis TaxID=1478221 RepID=A0A267MER1_9FIRM|nr:PH domain-containing protein [Anaeromicrobium sediminis]PAB57882.1 hypothetical protein CCE28_17960 [Anaeromicrobium sediminis]
MSSVIGLLLGAFVGYVIWMLIGSSYRVEGDILKVRGGLRKYEIPIHSIKKIVQTKRKGPAKGEEPEKHVFASGAYNWRTERVVFYTEDKNYMVSFTNTSNKEQIIHDIKKVKKDIVVKKDF